MRRVLRRTVLGAAALVALGALVVAAGVWWVLSSTSGRERVRRFAESQASALFDGRGSLTIGAIESLDPANLVLRDVALRDSLGRAVVLAQRVRAALAVRDLNARVIRLERLELDSVALDLRQEPGASFDIAWIIVGDDTTSGPAPTGPAFGRDVRIDSLVVRGLGIDASYPYEPYVAFTGSARDSVIALRDSLYDLTYRDDGVIIERRHVDVPFLVAHDGRVVVPGTAPRGIVIDTTEVRVAAPPVHVTTLRGGLQWDADSLWFRDVPARLPASELVAGGMLAWYDTAGVRYDITLVSGQLSLGDVQWTWPVLPPDGRASGRVRLRTLDDPVDLEVALDSLRIVAGDARVAGRITLVVEPVDLRLRDVALTFAPLDAPLLARLTEDAWPDALDGRLSGRWISDDGGTARALRLDTLALTYREAGAADDLLQTDVGGVVRLGLAPSVEEFTIRRMDIALPAARRALVALDAANDSVLPPALDGRLSVQGTLPFASGERAEFDALRARWVDGAGNVSTARASGTMTFASRFATDLTFAADTVSFDALHRLDTAFALRGWAAMDARAIGPRDSLSLTLAVRHASGGALGADVMLSVGEAVAAAGAAGAAGTTVLPWAVRGTLRVDSLDAAPWSREPVPATRIDGSLELFAAGRGGRLDTARVTPTLTQSASPRRIAASLTGQIAIGRDALQLDEVVFSGLGGTIEANGRLGRDTTQRGDLTVLWRPDSLAAIVPHLAPLAAMLEPVDTALASSVRALAEDTLRGDVSVSAYLEGALPRFSANVSFGGGGIRAGGVTIGSIFGSVRADSLPNKPHWLAAATLDSIEGIGALRIASVSLAVDSASARGGALRLSATGRDTSSLRVRGSYERRAPSTPTAGDGVFALRLDTLRFAYGTTRWANEGPLRWRNDVRGAQLDSFLFRSDRGGELLAVADLPVDGPISGLFRLDAFPAAEIAAFALGTTHLPTTATGTLRVTGSRDVPAAELDVRLDSLGTSAVSIDDIRLRGRYGERRLDLEATLADSLGGALSVQASVDVDLGAQADATARTDRPLRGAIVADGLRLGALPLTSTAVEQLQGRLDGRIDVTGTLDVPRFDGMLTATDVSARLPALGITPREGRAVVRMQSDSLVIDPLRVRSGPGLGDTLSLRAVLTGLRDSTPRLDARVALSSFLALDQANGTNVVVDGSMFARGPLRRPTAGASLFIPTADLVFDLESQVDALDLSAPDVQALLTESEKALTSGDGTLLRMLDARIDVAESRVRLGDDVWVRTAEANVQLDGDVSVLGVNGDQVSLDGEVRAVRGTYRLDLGVVQRGFTVDSGRVRFFPGTGVDPSVDLYATHVVRGVNGRDVPITVRIGGTLERPSLVLGTSDQSYASAPESELISLLVFGAPTFALDGQSQQTVRAVTGLLLPSLTGAVEGTLQRLLPVFNTVQINAAGGQSGDELGALSLLDNLSVTAGKQIGTNTYLRLDTGVCRGAASETAARTLSLWYGVAAEYRLAQGLTAQIGVDPGPSPCGQALAASNRRLQFGFDLFKEWVF